MRVLFEIVHPADVLFFKRPMEMLRARGDALLILSRHKDVACDLLDALGLAHEPVSTAGSGLIGLARELIGRDLATLRAARRFRPAVMVGFGGVALSHVTKVTGIPSVSFYDSENATLQTRLTRPFISHLYVPRAYTGAIPASRTTRLPGTKELSYFHPAAYRPDREIALAAGLDPDRDNFFVRVVAWRANHDVGKAGWDAETLRSVIARLSERGKVHLSSETELPDDLAPLAYRGRKDAVHHLMAHSRLLVGESATMASEAAILGVPAIYAGRDFPGYVHELEQAGLIRNIPAPDPARLTEGIEEMLRPDKSEIVARRDAYVASCPDWAEAVVAAVDRHANSA